MNMSYLEFMEVYDLKKTKLFAPFQDNLLGEIIFIVTMQVFIGIIIRNIFIEFLLNDCNLPGNDLS